MVVCGFGMAGFFFSDGTAARCTYAPDVRDPGCAWDPLPPVLLPERP